MRKLDTCRSKKGLKKKRKRTAFTLWIWIIPKDQNAQFPYPHIVFALTDPLDVDSAHHVLETVLNVLSISLNSFLLYLIVRHSNHGGKIYQVCLAVDAGLDLALGIACLVAQPVSLTLTSTSSPKDPSFYMFRWHLPVTGTWS